MDAALEHAAELAEMPDAKSLRLDLIASAQLSESPLGYESYIESIPDYILVGWQNELDESYEGNQLHIRATMNQYAYERYRGLSLGHQAMFAAEEDTEDGTAGVRGLDYLDGGDPDDPRW